MDEIPQKNKEGIDVKSFDGEIILTNPAKDGNLKNNKI
jgi:hypothetical protein